MYALLLSGEKNKSRERIVEKRSEEFKKINSHSNAAELD